MTREEAIYRLNNTAWLGSDDDRVATEEAVQMAIEALKEQPPLLEISKTVNREEFENIIKNSQLMLITPDTEKIELIREQQWIPCSERLPEEDKNVLVTVHFHGLTKEHSLGWNKQFKPSYYVEVANQIDGEWCSYSDEYKVAKDRHEVIAWMSLPAPYTEEEQ